MRFHVVVRVRFNFAFLRVARGAFQGFRNLPPLTPRNPPPSPTAANVSVPSIPRRTNQQQHHDNVPAQAPSDCSCCSPSRPSIIRDENILQCSLLFDDAVLSSLFNLLSELVAVEDRNPAIEAVLEFYGNDLPFPRVVDVELLRWKRKWCSTEGVDLPTSAYN